MRFEVPQFIDIEDKIFGPLTWRQFIYLGGGVGMGVTLFLTVGFWIFLLVGLPLALLAGALAFYPVNNRPFSFFLEAIVSYLTGKKLYLWRHNRDIVYRQEFSSPQPQARLGSERGTDSFTEPKIPLARRLELEAIQKTE